MTVNQGSIEDWKLLSGFHYRGHSARCHRRFFALKRGEEVCGVVAYCYAAPAVFGRRMVLPKMTIRQLNKTLSVISRVVVHPKYRSISLGAKLIRESLPLCGTKYVELLAVMGKYNLFAERAGMKRVTEIQAPAEALKIMSELEKLGFEKELVGSRRYIVKFLDGLAPSQVELVRQVLIRNPHFRLKKQLVGGKFWGDTTAPFREKVLKMDVEGLADMMKVVGFLLQSKVYLFWSSDPKVRFPS